MDDDRLVVIGRTSDDPAVKSVEITTTGRLAERQAPPNVEDVLEAVKRFTDVWGDSELAAEVAGSLSDPEVEALANVFGAYQRPETGQMWLQAHQRAETTAGRT